MFAILFVTIKNCRGERVMAKFKVKCFVKQYDKHDPLRKLATIMEAADRQELVEKLNSQYYSVQGLKISDVK